MYFRKPFRFVAGDGCTVWDAMETDSFKSPTSSFWTDGGRSEITSSVWADGMSIRATAIHKSTRSYIHIQLLSFCFYKYPATKDSFYIHIQLLRTIFISYLGRQLSEISPKMNVAECRGVIINVGQCRWMSRNGIDFPYWCLCLLNPVLVISFCTWAFHAKS